MTQWTLHPLNTRHALTPILSDIRAAAKDAVAQAGRHADLPRFDLVIRGEKGGGIPEWGVGGFAPAPGLIEVTVNPEKFSAPYLLRTIVHELHHVLRWDGPGYGRSLGEALVSEGLAGHFVLQVLGGPADPWDSVRASSALMGRAVKEWARLDYDHSEWFMGKGKIRKWAGYGLGHALVAGYLQANPGSDAAGLAATPADKFRESLRQLARSAGADADEAEDATG